MDSCLKKKERENVPIGLDGLFDFAGLEAFDADPDSLGSAINNGSYKLQVGQKPPRVNACYLLADAAFFPGEAPACYRPSGNRFLAAYFAYF